MPAPAPDDAPARRFGWKPRVFASAAVGLGLAGLVFGAVNAVELVLDALGKMHGFDVSAALVPLADAALVPDEVEEPVEIEEPPHEEKPVAPPVAAPPPVLDAGRDAGPPDVGAPVAAAVVDAGSDASFVAPPRLHACNPELVRRMETFYDRSTSFRATFDQELFVGAYGTTTRSHGSLVVAKPGRMSWYYDEPESSRIVSDGQTVSVYEAPNKHLFRVPAASSPYPGAFAFLTGVTPLSTVFELSGRAASADGVMDVPGMCVVIGTPTSLTRAYQRVIFYIDRVTFQIRRVMIFDREGDRNVIDLSDLSPHVPVDPDQFAFTPPPDTIVVGR